MRTKEAIVQLTGIGFSGYAAKACLALIQKSPATVYEVGKTSGVPSCEMLSKLKEKGILLETEA